MINIEINIIRVGIKKKAEIKEVKVEVREEEIKEAEVNIKVRVTVKAKINLRVQIVVVQMKKKDQMKKIKKLKKM